MSDFRRRSRRIVACSKKLQVAAAEERRKHPGTPVEIWATRLIRRPHRQYEQSGHGQGDQHTGIMPEGRLTLYGGVS
jgi:hypothetical protein